jgi:hypothetical protein
VLNTVFLSYPQRSFRANEGFLSSVPTLASAQASLDDETIWRLQSRRGRVFRDMTMWRTSEDSLKKEREGMEVLSFTDESRKRMIRVQQSTAEVMFPTCTWESAINVSFEKHMLLWLLVLCFGGEFWNDGSSCMFDERLMSNESLVQN